MDWSNVASTTETIQENGRQLSFFESALRLGLYNLVEQDYQRFRDLLLRFKQQGITIDQQETPVPETKIAEILQLSTTETIHIIEKYKIRYQSMNVYINQSNLLFFLLPKEPSK